ncbi:protein kinase [Dactylosporangium aurantiacum]|uniref:non-specific serine/threonine protein kinase n=1 Tax=Dactylosporangium aurantiacum TaxID=35754 RepID=A0A9Q9IRX1_9ACTN|nr:serine/threonine protein kinase [Dactylosporangium aurantiacum]UWZ58279.1 protein kinase [Dactylosporangium aurantiacum]
MSTDGGPCYVGPVDAPQRYELVERRAAGGEGEVWLAREHHGAASFRYAVKMIRIDDDAVAERQLEDLRLQAALATQVEHPALVKVKEVFVGPPPHAAGQETAGGRRLYFVMKWIDGHDLQEALERGEVRGLDVLASLEPVAEAVDHLHSGRDTNGAAVIHRDIKPANVLLAADGRVYLVDFGLVRLRSTDRTSRIFGTAPFMAPESLARGEYTPATDRYTLGATVYYAVTGEAPVAGDVDGMTQRLAAALGPGHDRQIRGVVAMLAIQPDARPASAAGWIRALRSAPPQTTAGLGLPALPATTGPGYASPPTTGPGYPSPPTSDAGFAPPPTSGPGFAPLPASGGGTTAYPLPPGSFAGAPASPRPVDYPMPPTAPPGGHLGAGQPKTGTGRTLLVTMGVVLALVAGCCFSLYKFGSSLDGSGGGGPGSGRPGATRSFDKSRPPPPVTELRSALVSVGDIAAVMSAAPNTVETRSEDSYLRGGLAKLQLCAGGAVAGDAIAGTETNNFKVTGAKGYPFVGSAVAGFYSDEAKAFFTALRATAGRCGWSQMQTPALGEESLGIFSDNGDTDKVAIVFVRGGQVVVEVAVTGAYFLSGTRGSYQSDAIQLATAMAKRLPKGGS